MDKLQQLKQKEQELKTSLEEVWKQIEEIDVYTISISYKGNSKNIKITKRIFEMIDTTEITNYVGTEVIKFLLKEVVSENNKKI